MIGSHGATAGADPAPTSAPATMHSDFTFLTPIIIVVLLSKSQNDREKTDCSDLK
jgi:hypothetical protein